jgi:hypothetical protein
MSGIHQTEIDLHSNLVLYTKAILGCQDECFVLICAEVVAVVVGGGWWWLVVVVVVAALAAIVVVAFNHPAAFDFVFHF